MIKKQPYIILLVFLVVVFGCGRKTDSTSKDINMDTLKGCMSDITLNIATTGTYAPFTYYAKNGDKVIGFDIDLINELQKLLGFKINNSIGVMNVSTITASITNGKIDMVLAALCATDERKSVMNFSNTYFDAGQIILINKEKSPAGITCIEDLIKGNYKIAVETGSAAHLFANKIGINEKNILTFNEGPIAFTALEEGKVDCFIQDASGIPYYLKVTPNSKIKMIGEQFNCGQSPYAIALSFEISKKYPNIVQVINAALDELTQNGTMDMLKKKWCQL